MTTNSPVREYRQKLGLTQADLARELDKNSRFTVTRQDIYKMETGNTTPKSRQLEIESLKFLAKRKEEVENAIDILSVKSGE